MKKEYFLPESGNVDTYEKYKYLHYILCGWLKVVSDLFPSHASIFNHIVEADMYGSTFI